MAGLSVFSYRAGSGLLHRLDVRFKLAMFALLSVAVLKSGPWGLVLLSLMTALALLRLKVALPALLHELRFFGLLLILVFGARAVFTPGQALIRFHGLTITQSGLADGALVCWRLALTVLISIVFISTTRFKEVKAAVLWLLRPLPFFPGATMALTQGEPLRSITI